MVIREEQRLRRVPKDYVHPIKLATEYGDQCPHSSLLINTIDRCPRDMGEIWRRVRRLSMRSPGALIKSSALLITH